MRCPLSESLGLRFWPPGRIGAIALGLMLSAIVGGAFRPAFLYGQQAEASRPNIIFILADDLGYGDLGCYGQQLIRTPNLDRLAAEGMRFTQFYAGSTVCAPSRCVLMVGQHTGRCSVRGNADKVRQSLVDEDFTVAELLKRAGYATAIIGKWGLGEEDTPGHPNRQGFDYFFGYLNQTHAHNYYPEFLWRNWQKVPLGNVLRREGKPYEEIGAGVAEKKVVYSHDLFTEEALRFINAHQDRPFFLYLCYTVPHANNEATRLVGDGQEVPDYGIYAEYDWPNPDKGQAAMITRLDRDIGRIVELLRNLGIADRTLVLFSSDNGPHKEGGQNFDRFRPAGPLRGLKRDLYEGGIRVPLIACWPGKIQPGSVSDHIGYFGDFLATAAELAGLTPPEGLDSISFVPTLLGRPEAQKQHRYLYWEFYERGSAQAVRAGKWKAVRKPMISGKTELYDLEADLGEQVDLAERFPAIVAQMEAFMNEAHVPSPRWPVPTSSTVGKLTR